MLTYTKTKQAASGLATALIVLASLTPQYANAASLYLADITTSLTITSIIGGGAGTSIEGEVFTGNLFADPPIPEAGFTFTTGAATTDLPTGSATVTAAVSALDMKVDDGFMQTAKVSGMAAPPGFSQSLSAYVTTSILTIDNTTGGAEVTVSLELAYDYTLEVSADDFAHEDALAIVDFHVTDFDSGADIFDPLDIFDLSTEPLFLDTFIDGSSTFTSIFGSSTTFDITVAAGDLINILTTTDAIGIATTVVPEPSTIFLLGSGLLGLIGYSRSRAA